MTDSLADGRNNLLEHRISACLAMGDKLPGSRVYYRTEWDCYYFDVAGKFFGLLFPQADKGFITLKNLPEVNQELRDLYPEAIKPGWHLNKTHWNSISLDAEPISLTMLEELIKQSYDLVVAKLPKTVQRQLDLSKDH